ncbi:MAG: hypothetical protein H0U59_09465 [Gemmatimonadaceae bacterium]|nr:hypothetical protein [Gemmatimonadaceae bacterium]
MIEPTKKTALYLTADQIQTLLRATLTELLSDLEMLPDSPQEFADLRDGAEYAVVLCDALVEMTGGIPRPAGPT